MKNNMTNILHKIYLFWFRKKDNYNKWFYNSNKYDEYIKINFEKHLIFFKDNYKKYIYTIKQVIALIILFDQFSRQIYRNDSRAYSFDHIAKDISLYLVELGIIYKLTENEQLFALLPIQHSEDIDDLYFLRDLLLELGNNKLFLHHTLEHIKVLEKFGRYPKRNKALNEVSTPEELNYIEQNPDRDY